MKARLFVVNNDTINTVLENMVISTMVPGPVTEKNKKKKMWNKTIIDIMSDLTQLEIGDYIFLWESSSNVKSRIYGVFRVLSKPYYEYEQGQNDPFKIKIGKAYVFEQPVDEYDIINNPYMKNELWTIIGKKVAGKSRGSTPITNSAMEFLIQSLIDKNNGRYEFIEPQDIIQVNYEVNINLENEYVDKIPNSLKEFEFNNLFHRVGNKVQYEKSLECIMNFLMRERKKDILREIEINVDEVIWFANYLPYGIEGSEIDYMVMESKDGVVINKIDVIEFMKDGLDVKHIEKCVLYAKWVKDTIAKNNRIVRPIVICGPNSRLESDKIESIKTNTEISGIQSLDIYKYEIYNAEIKFTKLT